MTIKDIHKNPFFYYVLVPVVIALWPLLIWSLYLPGAQQKWEKEKTQYAKAQQAIEEILIIDPDRLDYAKSKAGSAGFDYASAIDAIASKSRIKPTSYTLSSGIIMTSGGQKSQSARLSLKDVDIKKFATFLSTIQLRWANLQCTQVKLTKKKGLKDTWNADLDFKYYY